MSRANARTTETERLKRLRQEAKNLTGLDKALLDDLLVEYDAISSMVDSVKDAVLKHGVMVTKMVGSVNNRHEETVENPEFTTYQKAVGRKGDLAKKLSDFYKRSDDEGGEVDELEAFIRR